MVKQSINSFIEFLIRNRITRFYFGFDPDTKSIFASHDKLEGIRQFLQNDSRDFDTHEALFFELDERNNVIHSAVIHRTNRGQAAGGVRFWEYETVEDFIRDGLRLSKGMTHKNALAGLWWGGGKGVIANTDHKNKTDTIARSEVYTNYGKFITSLNGCYVTAEDAGTNVSDMENIFAQTRFTTCIPPKFGGSGNPSVPTAKGVVCGMEAALDFLDRGSFADKVIAVQGLGNVSIPMIHLLFTKGVKKVIGCDIFEERVNLADKEFESKDFTAKLVGLKDNSILFEDCDILSPCATGASLNFETIPNIKASIICGAANNQLADPEKDDMRLHDQNILYVPDFLTNRMGIVNCANEQYGYVTNDPSIEIHYDKNWEHSIYQTAMSVFSESKTKSIPTGKAALKIAEELSLVPHPIFGHRSRKIISSLINSNWESI